jgi:hypothetical protein
LRRILRDKITDLLPDDRDQRVMGIQEEWELDWYWMCSLLEWFEHEITADRAEELAEWLIDGCPVASEQIADNTLIASVA